MYTRCQLCERRCGVNRAAGELGFCKSSDEVRIARASLHMWEEPPISGSRGSGAIFFSGCSLGCIYCQNREISHVGFGEAVSIPRLSEIMLELQQKGAHNINFVTPTHFAPSVAKAISLARAKGLSLPTVYNTGSFDSTETLSSLEGLIDIYLPDLKYYRSTLAERYSGAASLPQVSRSAIDTMVEQVGAPVFDSEGIMQRGVIVRLLLLPSATADARLNLKYLYSRYGDKIYVSLMSQYTPNDALPPPLNRRVTKAEYRSLVDYAVSLGVKNAFVQDTSSSKELYIPAFDGEGVK